MPKKKSSNPVGRSTKYNPKTHPGIVAKLGIRVGHRSRGGQEPCGRERSLPCVRLTVGMMRRGVMRLASYHFACTQKGCLFSSLSLREQYIRMWGRGQ